MKRRARRWVAAGAAAAVLIAATGARQNQNRSASTGANTETRTQTASRSTYKTTMPTLTAAQVYAAARAAGFPAETARQMTAIARRESSFNPGVVGTINAAKETSYGLWQINWKDAGIRRLLEQNGITDPAQLYDPVTNARAAYLLWGGNDSNLNTAWYINRTGSPYGYAEKYQQYLAQLPGVEDLEAVYTGAGRLGGPGTVGGAGGGIVAAGSGGGATINYGSTDGVTYTPQPGGGSASGSGWGDGLDLSAFGLPGGGGDGGGQQQTAAIAGLSPMGWAVVIAAGLFVWWWRDGD